MLEECVYENHLQTACSLKGVGFGLFLDAQMDDQDLNEPIAKVALLKGKQIYICNSRCRIYVCIYRYIFVYLAFIKYVLK